MIYVYYFVYDSLFIILYEQINSISNRKNRLQMRFNLLMIRLKSFHQKCFERHHVGTKKIRKGRNEIIISYCYTKVCLSGL